MPSWKCAVTAGGLALAALLPVAGQSAPPHPTSLLAEYKGARHVVVAVEKDVPVILVEGRRKVLRGNPPLSTERLAGYRGLRASLKGIRTSGVQVVSAMSELDAEEAATKPAATLGGYVEFTATVTADQDLADCYLALFAVDDTFMQGASDRPNAQIRVRQIKDLRAGQSAQIQFSTTPFLLGRKARVFALLFSGGDEVFMPQAAPAWKYFQRRERVIHTATVRHWLDENPGANRPAQPVLQIPPRFTSTEGFPRSCAVTLTVSPDGTVSDVDLSNRLPDPADETLREALQSWLFLPQIENGAAKSCRVTVPLTF
jgi:TonB family protein